MVRRSTPRTSAPSEPAIGVTVMVLIRNSSNAESIEARCGPAEQIGLLGGARALGQSLAGVPVHAVAVRTLVDREIAFEHRPVGAEGRDAGLDIRPPQRRELLGARRQLALVHVEAEHPHAEAAQFHMHVGTRRQLLDARAPLGEDLVALALVAAEPDRAADMVETDRRLRESARQVDDIAELRMIDPGVEAETE